MILEEKSIDRVEHKVLYKKRLNRYLKERLGAYNPMTLIFGAKCVDGVVLVSDRLVKSGENISYGIDKIRKCGNINWAIFGAAGYGTLFEEYMTLLPQYVNRRTGWMKYQNAKLEQDREEAFKSNPNAPHPPLFEYTIEDFKHDCAELLTEMRNRYAVAFQNNADCVLQILIGAGAREEAKLYYLDSEDCLPAEVPESLFIGQHERVEVFRKCWSPSMTMGQAAKLGAFTIKYVETDKISESVGVGTNGVPQIWCIPDGSLPTEVSGGDLEALMKVVNQECNLVYSKLHSLFRS